MAYQIWLYDETQSSVQLDTDDLMMTTTFNISDIADISTRKETITKSIKLKATKTNNLAFGSMHVNKVVNTSLDNKFGFNYSPLRPVPCLVYEDGKLLFKGTLRITAMVPSNDKREGYYEATITGNLVEFKAAVGDLELTDLDLSDLRHPYHIDVIKDSWTISTRTYDASTNTFNVVPFERGKGYLYGHVDYGVQFKDESNSNVANTDTNRFNALNLRPGLYAKEIFNRIFEQSGFTWELRGGQGLNDKFSSLWVPNAQEKFISTFNGFNMKFSKPFPQVVNQTTSYSVMNAMSQFIPIQNVTNPPAGTISPYLQLASGTNNVVVTNRNFKTDARVGVVLSGIQNNFGLPTFYEISLMEAPSTATPDQSNLHDDGFKPIIKKTFTVMPMSSYPDQIINLNIPERDFENQKQYAVCVLAYRPNVGLVPTMKAHNFYTVDFAEVSFPKDAATTFTADIKFDDTGTNPDIVKPVLPPGIKQFDFIKNVMQLFNLYYYTEKNNPRHIIFELYDDYYALTSPYYITSTALNWTYKVDLPSVKIKSKLDLPKKYLFTYKEDSDWINERYKNTYGAVYGRFQSTDAFGVTDSKKIEVIFSPTPVISPAGTGRLIPALYKVEDGNKKTTKTNIRMLYFTGYVPCNNYLLQKDFYDTTNSVWTTLTFNELGQYPRVSPYWFDFNNNPTETLDFGRANEFYFSATIDYINVRTGYQNYFIGQVTELTNPNIQILECDINLNEIDISNLDLKVPIFIDLPNGHAYWKILSIDYLGNNAKSKLTALKIYNGTER
ncbi:MAG: hypothetical protein QM737_02750 [Ferruginibacter sp.]